MLILDFYAISEFETSEKQVQAKINLNPDHEVYNGHFPGQPVVPGVIQIQIIKELTEKKTGSSLFLSNLTFAKFLQPIVPDQSMQLIIDISYRLDKKDEISFSATISNDDLKHTKIKGVFVIE